MDSHEVALPSGHTANVGERRTLPAKGSSAPPCCFIKLVRRQDPPPGACALEAMPGIRLGTRPYSQNWTLIASVSANPSGLTSRCQKLKFSVSPTWMAGVPAGRFVTSRLNVATPKGTPTVD